MATVSSALMSYREVLVIVRTPMIFLQFSEALTLTIVVLSTTLVSKKIAHQLGI